VNGSTLAASLAVSLLAATPVFAQEEFTELADLVPNRCFSAALSAISPGSVNIGIESATIPPPG
jgi:hypothetical protein